MCCHDTLLRGGNLIRDYFLKWENIMRYISHRCVLSQQDGNAWERGLIFFFFIYLSVLFDLLECALLLFKCKYLIK